MRLLAGVDIVSASWHPLTFVWSLFLYTFAPNMITLMALSHMHCTDHTSLTQWPKSFQSLAVLLLHCKSLFFFTVLRFPRNLSKARSTDSIKGPVELCHHCPIKYPYRYGMYSLTVSAFPYATVFLWPTLVDEKSSLKDMSQIWPFYGLIYINVVG